MLRWQVYKDNMTQAGIQGRFEWNLQQQFWRRRHQRWWGRERGVEPTQGIGKCWKNHLLSITLLGSYLYSVNIIHPQGHPEFSINPVFFATCAPLFINASVVIIYRYYRYIYISNNIHPLFVNDSVLIIYVSILQVFLLCINIHNSMLYILLHTIAYWYKHIWELYKRCGLYTLQCQYLKLSSS